MATAKETIEQANKGEGCLGRSKPDEIVFVLCGRDRCAPEAIRKWARMAVDAGAPREKVEEALKIAASMERGEGRKYPD